MAGGAARVGRTTVRVRGLEAYARRARVAAVGQARESLLSRAAPILSEAQAKWPVETGRSRSGLEPPRVAVSGDLVRLTVRNPVEYAENVRVRGARGLRAWVVYVLEPVRKLGLQAQAIAAEINAAIDAAGRRRRG